jgi:hypothetical protein
MHLNISGKEKVAKLIGESIVKLMSREKVTPFILKWREEQKDPHHKVNEDNPTNDVSDGTTPEASRSTKKLEEKQSKSGNPVLTTSTAQDQAEGIIVPIMSNDQPVATPQSIGALDSLTVQDAISNDPEEAKKECKKRNSVSSTLDSLTVQVTEQKLTP